jgi:hypothetical protein
MAKDSRFSFDKTKSISLNTTYFIPTDDMYLLGILNSSTVWKYCKESLTVLGDAEKGGRLRFFRQFVSKLPVPMASASEQKAISALVQKCLDANGQRVELWEAEINDRVARLYGLTADEIELIAKN